MELKQLQKHHPIFLDNAGIQMLCQPLQRFGITFFSHVRLYADNSATFICNSAKWTEVFFGNNYTPHSVCYYPLTSTEHIILADTVKRRGMTQKILDEFHAIGYGHMITIIQQHENYKDIFHFAGNPSDEQLNNRYLWHMSDLRSFLHYYKSQSMQHKSLRAKNNLMIDIPEHGKFDIEENIPNNENDFTNYYQQLRTDRIYINNEYLTQREFECLHWLSLGKTQDETAMIMNISTRTVQAHIDNIKNKTQCKNQLQLGILYKQLKDQVSTSVV